MRYYEGILAGNGNAVSRTNTEAVMLKASKISSTKLGTGTSITNTMLTAAVGTTQSTVVFKFAGFDLLVVAIA